MVCEMDRKPSQVAADLNLKVNTVRKIAREFRTLGKRECKERGGAQCSKKITPAAESFIKDLIDKDCTLTLDEIKDKVFEHSQIGVSASTIARLTIYSD